MPKIKILADAMFGKLGKFLRIMGFDSEVADNSLPDPEVMKQAIAQNRILITRDELFYEEAERYYNDNNLDKKLLLYAPYQDLEHQLAVFMKFVGLNLLEVNWEGADRAYFNSHCAKCNGTTIKVDKQAILDQIPPGTADQYENFWQCQNSDCKHIFWVGKAHWIDIIEKIQAAINLISEV